MAFKIGKPQGDSYQPRCDRERFNGFSLRNRIGRKVWHIVWLTLFRTTPSFLHPWRCFLLRLFGAKVGRRVHVYPSCRIWAPWNLEMQARSCLSHYVDCYCVAPISLERRAIVSQYSFLCTADKNYDTRELIAEPIRICANAWVCADAFIAPGVTVGEGAVVGARASVFRDVPPWAIVGGNPASLIRMRKPLANSKCADSEL
jgi:putative colanic acid biosynthesis acetyltransferase WcaF